MNAIKMSIVSAIIAAAYFVCLAAASNQVEVCQWETFEARCASDEVILMKEARYGRMRVGKCLTRNYMVGCSSDVTNYMHGRCSGRQHCRVPVPDPIMFASQPCPKDLVAYLEADYECMKVAKWNKESCDQVMTSKTGLIAKPADTVADIRKKHHCPRRIVAQPGQTINVYLSDFYNKYHHHHTYDVSATAVPVPDCINYGHITEDGTAAPSGICGGVMKKDALVYRSKSNVIDITLAAPSSHSHHYLIKYEVVGCPTLHAPKNGWIDFQEDKAIVHCNNSHTASEMICMKNQWVGEMQDCSVEGHPIQMAISAMSSSPFTNTGLMVAIAVGVAFGVVVGIVLIIIAARRSKKAAPELQLPIYEPTTKADELKKCFNGSPDYQVYAPVVDPNFIPVATEDGEKVYLASNPGVHIVNLSSFTNYNARLPNGLPALSDADNESPVFTA